MSEVSVCLVTHSHMDHCKAVPALCASGIDVFMPRKEIKAARDLREVKHSHRLHPLEKCPGYGDYLVIGVGTFDVRPFAIEHDTPEPVGYLCASSVTGEKLLYFTDTYYLKYTFRGLTHIMGECNYSKEQIEESVRRGYIPEKLVPRLIQSHMSLEHFLDLLRANDISNVRQIYLLHLSQNNSNAEQFKKAVQQLTGTEVYVC